MGDANIRRQSEGRKRLAVIGGGIAGLSAAWLLSSRHHVTLFEAGTKLGGHSNTVDAAGIPVDTGFIVYNDLTYPNLNALFNHLGVETQVAPMSFAVSLDAGRCEYGSSGLRGLMAQPSNAFRPRFWRMFRDLLRFYETAAPAIESDARWGESVSLDAFLSKHGYSNAFRDDHLLPMAAAIWSTPAAEIGQFPAAALIRFCETHGLLKLRDRPVWKTVTGGSRNYVKRLVDRIPEKLTGMPITAIRRHRTHVEVIDGFGVSRSFEQIVIATHADTALAMLADASEQERRLLSAFRYNRNQAVLHGDPSLMPARRRIWSSWNYLSSKRGDGQQLSVTYWMNRLQGLPQDRSLFVTLNPLHAPRDDSVFHQETYEHPLYDTVALRAQKELWSLQGQRNTWFCGAYFGAGFHEDALQAGLAVAEELGGVRRPWVVEQESGRIFKASEQPLRRTASI